MTGARRCPQLVELDAIGGVMILLRADLHRDGLIFPPYPCVGVRMRTASALLLLRRRWRRRPQR